MSIEEKPRALEFTFVDNKNNNLRYEITYDSENSPISPITITVRGGNMCMPVELFVEVVDFLKQKGVIKSGKNNPPSGGSRVKKATTIPLPVIDGEQEEEEIEEKMIQTNPIISFDTSEGPEEIIKEIIKEVPSEEKIIISKEKKDDENIPKRTVIKTKKFDENDPLQAERESAELRGKKKSNFRRKE